MESYPAATRGRKRRAPWLGFTATAEDSWAATLKALPTDFFTSRDARMLMKMPFKPGETGYGSVPLTKENNRDVHRFWKNNVETEEMCGRSSPSWPGWLRVWGQFARVCIASKYVAANDLVREGYFFGCFQKREFLECFLHYYRMRGRPGTVSSKALQLNKMAGAAYTYFMSTGEHETAGRVKENIAVSFFECHNTNILSS